MMGKFDKMLEKKGKKLSPLESKAKGDVLSSLRSQFADKVDEKMGGMKKVSVAAPDVEGLAEGLEKAEELVEQMPKSEEADEMKSYEDCSAEELQQKIDMLMKLKEEKLQEEQE